MYSVVGRTRTIPRADDDIARWRIAFFGCSNLVTSMHTARTLYAVATPADMFGAEDGPLQLAQPCVAAGAAACECGPDIFWKHVLHGD